MALIKWGALVTDGRGKLGGQVLTKGRSGAVIRNKVTPVNGRTTAQMGARNRLTSYSQAWKALTQAQRDQWNTATGEYPKTNIFGDTVYPTGKNLFTMLNINLALVGVAQINVPPVPVGGGSMDSMSIAMANGADTAALTFATSPVPAGYAFLMRATAGMSPGRDFVSSELKFIGYLDAADTTPEDFKAAYNAVFGSIPAVGTKVFFEVVGINKTTGEAGTPLRTSYIIVA
jgi:hypothetical protein